VRLGADNFLLDHLGGGFDLLVFGASVPADVQATVKAWQAKGLKLRMLLIGQATQAEGADVCLPEPDGHARARWGVETNGAAYLLRPDQHVCARWLTMDAQRLNAALSQATTGDAQ
jgi:3-(3-hydroxy-phenyl)propionate hydroxylase